MILDSDICKEADEVMWWTSPRVRMRPQIERSDVGCDPGPRSQHKEGPGGGWRKAVGEVGQVGSRPFAQGRLSRVSIECPS